MKVIATNIKNQTRLYNTELIMDFKRTQISLKVAWNGSFQLLKAKNGDYILWSHDGKEKEWNVVINKSDANRIINSNYNIKVAEEIMGEYTQIIHQEVETKRESDYWRKKLRK